MIKDVGVGESEMRTGDVWALARRSRPLTLVISLLLTCVDVTGEHPSRLRLFSLRIGSWMRSWPRPTIKKFRHLLASKAQKLSRKWQPATTPIYYINLDHRTDRRQHIVHELQRMGLHATRIPAVYEPQREILGCAKSHILAIEQFLDSGASCGIVLEDDFTFHDDKKWVKDQLTRLFASEVPWDLVMLSGAILESTETDVPGLLKVSNAQTTSGYMVTRHFAPVLLQNLREGAALLEDHFRITGKKKHEWCLDQYWKLLQPTANWYIFYPKLGFQMESYSDIEKRVVQYGGT
jgi:GR25 family glycosyltransferase involved in LPS biosynthesis